MADQQLRCPHDGNTNLEVRIDPDTKRVKIACSNCGTAGDIPVEPASFDQIYESMSHWRN